MRSCAVELWNYLYMPSWFCHCCSVYFIITSEGIISYTNNSIFVYCLQSIKTHITFDVWVQPMKWNASQYLLIFNILQWSLFYGQRLWRESFYPVIWTLYSEAMLEIVLLLPLLPTTSALSFSNFQPLRWIWHASYMGSVSLWQSHLKMLSLRSIQLGQSPGCCKMWLVPLTEVVGQEDQVGGSVSRPAQ